MATRLLAAELSSEGFTVSSLSPGWVDTDQGRQNGDPADGKPLRQPVQTVECSIRDCLATILSLESHQSGAFVNYNKR